MRNASGRRILRPAEILILVCGIVAAAGLLHLTLRPVDHSHGIDLSTNVQKYVNVRSEHPKVGSDGSDRSRVGEHQEEEEEEEEEEEGEEAAASSMEAITNVGEKSGSNPKACATVEEMGVDSGGESREQSLAFRKLVRDHFDLYGAPRVRRLPPAQFCKHGFVLGKSSEAGFGNEMYKILTGAALSMMLNRSLIIGQTRHFGANFLLKTLFLTPTLPLP